MSEAEIENEKAKKIWQKESFRNSIAYGIGYAVLFCAAFLGILVDGSIVSLFNSKPNPAWTLLVRMGYASRVHRSYVIMDSWDTGEYKTCTSANSADYPVGLNCGGSQERDMDVRYYGMTHSRDAGSPSVLTWDCKKVDKSEASIECRH